MEPKRTDFTGGLMPFLKTALAVASIDVILLSYAHYKPLWNGQHCTLLISLTTNLNYVLYRQLTHLPSILDTNVVRHKKTVEHYLLQYPVHVLSQPSPIFHVKARFSIPFCTPTNA
jgi:hypothetical protein